MPGAVFLEGERLNLRTVRPDDYEFIARHFTTPEMRHGGFEDIRTPISPEDVRIRVEQTEDYQLFLACAEGEPIGCTMLVDIDLEGRKAELGYWITPGEQGQGYATEAAELGLVHAFDQLGVHKVWARTIADNEGSKRVLEKLGFQQEGLLREHWLGFDRFVDEVRWGLLASEW